MKKLKNLNEKELKETNGGHDSSNSGQTGNLLGIDNLLTITIETSDGDRSTKNTLSVGNDINGDISGGFMNKPH